MGTITSTLWKIEPHTKAKHAILKNYLNAWYPILNRFDKRLNYIDGFAGPGKYLDGEDGSPIIVLDLVKNHKRNLRGEFNFIFIEKDRERCEYLKSEIESNSYPSFFEILVENDEYDKVLKKILDKLEKDGNNLAPTFAFIDPFGFKGIPFKIIKKLLSMPKVEVFITFMIDSINRFLEVDNVEEAMVELFDSPEILELLPQWRNRRNEIRNFYQMKLSENAKYVRYFLMSDINSKPIYYLFFATNHELGHMRMKEAMWMVDSNGDFRFSDETDKNQPMLFYDSHDEKLFNIIKSNFGKGKYKVENFRNFIENKTPYLVKHMKKSLKYAEENSLIKVDDLKSNKCKRKGKTFPDEVIIELN